MTFTRRDAFHVGNQLLRVGAPKACVFLYHAHVLALSACMRACIFINPHGVQALAALRPGNHGDALER